MIASGNIISGRRAIRDNPDACPSAHDRAVTVILRGMEGVLLLLVILSPWCYGAVHPGFEFLLDAGIGVLLLLWAVRMLLEGQLTWKKSPVAVCLAGLFLLGIWQVTPLPRSWLAPLSPATARLYDQLLPAEPEVLSAGVERPSASAPPGSTLSLYPGVTRKELARLLAVFLVFAFVRNNLVSTAALMRLSIVALVNGAMLSLFALAQFFSAPPKTVYWIYPTLGQVFGPFINRNHFPYYVNMCIGLGLGLLVSRGARRQSGSLDAEPSGSLLRVLHDPASLWICAALGLMMSSVALCRSRGGMLALVGAAVVCAILGRLRLGGSFRLGAGLLIGAVTLSLTCWFGLGLVKTRLDTFWSGEAFDNRMPLWMRSLPIAADYPLGGTGYGTYGHVEPLYRTDVPPAEAALLYDHAHNDYLEILIEAGVPGLVLVLLVVAVVYRLGYRTLGADRGSSAAGLTLGALFAFTTVVLHSIGDFGMHVPAIALLTTVVVAHLCARGRSAQARIEEYRLRLGGVAPLLGAAAALALALMICAAAWKAHRIDRLEDAAVRAGDDTEEHLRRRVVLLAAAGAIGRDDAALHEELGHARKQLFERANHGRPPTRRTEAAQALPVLQAYLQARDACPLLMDAQLGLAELAPQLARGDTREAYLHRAKLLARDRADRWYLCGRIELDADRPEDAWASWRRSLELSEDYLTLILPRSAARLNTDALLEKVLPDRASTLLAATFHLHPDLGATEERRPFLEKALRVLAAKDGPLDSEDLRAKALVHKAMDQPEASVAAYRKLLGREPRRIEWRFEFARYLQDLHRLDECHRELVIVLNQDPNNGPARKLMETVMQDLLRERSDERKGAARGR
jgi:O-antigen ligase/tetratricopeptide (TPR) repeat protein